MGWAGSGAHLRKDAAKGRQVNGFVWPERDIECARAVFRTLDDLELAVACCDQRRTVIQAGGNCGVWPARLADYFEHVITFEPDAENFDCLRQNVPANVTAFHGALGEKQSRVGLHRDPKNCGAYYVEELGNISMVTIDDQHIANVDLICLDIEGYEYRALRGAVDTITRCHPVIQIEDKGLSDKYGTPKGAVVDWLTGQFGYEVRHRVNRDVILA